MDWYADIFAAMAERDELEARELVVRSRFAAERVAASPLLARVGVGPLGASGWAWWSLCGL